PLTQDSTISKSSIERFDEEGRFYSPLVRSMAEKEGVTFDELKQIKGSGSNGRILKKDFQEYLQEGRKSQQTVAAANQVVQTSSGAYEGRHEIIEMDRMRGMIADHMVESKRTSP